MGCKLSVSVVHPAENFVKKILSPNKTKSKEINENESKCTEKKELNLTNSNNSYVTVYIDE